MQKASYALVLSALLASGGAAAQVTPPAQPSTPQTPTPPVPASPTETAPAPAPQPIPPGVPAPPTQSQQAIAPPPPPAESVPYGAGMKVNLSPDGSKYLRFITWHQIWTRYTQNNTGTLRAQGKPQADQVDFAVRRSRLIILSQLNPRFLIYTHIGINNQTAVSGGVNPTADGKKPQLFIHEAVVEFKVNKYLSLGSGMHYQNGLSRLTRSSTLNFLTLDAPLTNWPIIETADQFARGIGAYAKGRVSKLDYAFSVNETFLTNQTSTPLSLGVTTGTGTAVTSTGTNVAQYNPQSTKHIFQGYLSWEFLEQESNLLPFNVGSYLGTKRVFNLGGGFLYNADGMYSRATSSVVNGPVMMAAGQPGANVFDLIPTRKHDIALLSADVFFDTPINKEKGTAFTVYGVYYNYNFGPNHVRYIGASNPGYGASALRGNAVPHSGTGNIGFVESGYLLPKNTLGPKVRLQPYASYLLASYEGLRKPNGNIQNVNILDAGANFYLDGHNAKFTINYRHRPDFTNQTPTPEGPARVNGVKYRPEITLQTQVFL
ncbi:hypothetical protein [Solirubrum puertoriconensis]|uniref:Porin n=1 Tax=Solirubrum puertoriconensis TaxID=1751427 RepID=A0A9X0HKM2_SOLP1|nr:hypothetical protein [Solirubrum puertoriconensis]KUG07640.1 hypothetical protein ASU33_15025 [Solirubrum puertoriconensis]